MNTSNLIISLDKTIERFTDEVELLFNGEDCYDKATKEDLFELSKHVAYALDDFKKAIVQNSK